VRERDGQVGPPGLRSGAVLQELLRSGVDLSGHEAQRLLRDGRQVVRHKAQEADRAERQRQPEPVLRPALREHEFGVAVR
jgi:hypothetical protein